MVWATKCADTHMLNTQCHWLCRTKHILWHRMWLIRNLINWQLIFHNFSYISLLLNSCVIRRSNWLLTIAVTHVFTQLYRTSLDWQNRSRHNSNPQQYMTKHTWDATGRRPRLQISVPAQNARIRRQRRHDLFFAWQPVKAKDFILHGAISNLCWDAKQIKS